MPRFSAGQSVANQIRTKHLGVMSGGTQGRAKFMHKGVGLNQNKGGMNTKGSMPAMRPMRPPANKVQGPTPQPAAKPKFNKPAGGFRYVPRNGKRTAVRWDRLTDAERAQFGNGPELVADTPAATEQPSAPETPGGLPDTLDYRGLSSYQGGMSELDYELAGQRADLTRQLAENKITYGRERGDLKRNYERDVETGEDGLSRGNLLRSGVREVADADRFREFGRYMTDLEQQYGSGATAKINEALAGLDRFEAEARRRIEESARSEYSELYPAAPIEEDEFADEGDDSTPAATPPAARRKAKAPPGMQFVKDPARPGKFKLRPIPGTRADAVSRPPVPARTPTNTPPVPARRPRRPR